ncbi:MAG: sugar ABC transporter ATP-binding protein [Planctomycetota bacterium]
MTARRLDSPALAAGNVSRSFPGVRALDGVDFAAYGGEITALVGENGAGKSTLMKVLAGLLQPDAGQIKIGGQSAALTNPADALRRGIALIHQELSLCDNLTVAEALFLGAELRRGPWLRRQAMKERARSLLQRLGLDVDPDLRVAELRLGQRQLLEIARAPRADAKVLLMDEPTSSPSASEVDRLFPVLDELRQAGVAIVYITHRLQEVARLADRVVGLRDGRNSGELSRHEIDPKRVVELMVGRGLEPLAVDSPPVAGGSVALRVESFATRMFAHARVDLELRQGEIVGIAGLLGSGRSELLRALFGIDRRAAGRVFVCGRELVEGASVRAAMDAGLALLPEDRKGEGLVLGMSVRENLSMATLACRGRGLWLDRGYERELCTNSVAELQIACRDGEQAVGGLSGGNQQKVVLGRWLATEPAVLLLDEPTRGVDVGARQEIYRRLAQLRQQGMAVLFVSSELEEVLQLADRVLVLRDGQIQGELLGAAGTEDAIMRLAMGGQAAAAASSAEPRP